MNISDSKMEVCGDVILCIFSFFFSLFVFGMRTIRGMRAKKVEVYIRKESLRPFSLLPLD